MSRAGSEPAPPPGSRAREAGLTLIEMTVALVVASILVTVTYRFFKDMYGSYNLQEQVAERDQNAHFALSRMVELLQQAGSGLPDSGWTVIRREGGDLFVGMNPRAAEHFNGVSTGFSQFVGVGDARSFRDADNALQSPTHVLIDYANPALGIVRIAIDAGYNDRGFVAGIKDNARGLDSIRLVSGVALTLGDRIFGFREYIYQVTNGNLIIRPDGLSGPAIVLAENIDSLGITFRDRRDRVTTVWRDMQSATITIRARTARPDPKLPRPGYRMTTVSMNVDLRNRM